MKKYIKFILTVFVIVFLPILILDLVGNRYELEKWSAQDVIETSKELHEKYAEAKFGTESHMLMQNDLIKRLEAYGYKITEQSFKQLGSVIGDDYYVKVGAYEYTLDDLLPIIGGRATGTEYIGDVVLLNTVESYDPSLVKDRFVMLTNFGNVEDTAIEKLYDSGCAGILTGTTFYQDGFTKMDYSALDGKIIPMLHTSEAFTEKFIELGKNSQKERRQVSVGLSYTNVDFFDVGVIEDVHIKIDQTIEMLDGKNIIASKADNTDALTYIFATHYDAAPYMGEQGIYHNITSVATLLEMAERLKDETLNEQVAFIFFDGGMVGQAGASYYRENKMYSESDMLFLENLGFKNHLIFGNGKEGSFSVENFYQYADQQLLSFGQHGWLENVLSNSGALRYIQNEERVSAITMNQAFNPHTIYANPLTEENFGGLIGSLDHFIKVEIMHDEYPEFMPFEGYLLIFGVCVILLIFSTIEFFKDHKQVYKLYNTTLYKLIKNIVNTVLLFTITLLIILVISILPETFNVQPQYGMNYNMYTLLEKVVLILQNFVTEGFGLSSMGIPYLEIIIDNSLISFKLLSLALVLSMGLGLFVGLMSCYTKKSYRKQQSILVIFGLSIPETVIIIGLLFSLKYIMKIPLIEDHFEVSRVREFYLPLISMMVVPTIYISRIVYIEVIEAMSKKFIVSLKAKGVKKNRIYTHHLFKLVFNKVLNTMPIILAIGISTMIIAERLFAVPGLIQNIFFALDKGIYMYYIGLVLTIMIYYYFVILLSKGISSLLMPSFGGAYEME